MIFGEHMKTLSLGPASALTRRSSRLGMDLRRLCFSFLFFLAGILVCGSVPHSSSYGATQGANPAASTTSITGKAVELNGTAMPAGATLFSGDVIRLGEASTVALRFGNSSVLAAPL